MPLSLQRAISSDPDVISTYFDLLEQAIEDYGLERKLGNIFMDETGMPVDPKPLKTIQCKGEKKPVATGSGLKTQITVVGCVSAGGLLPTIHCHLGQEKIEARVNCGGGSRYHIWSLRKGLDELGVV